MARPILQTVSTQVDLSDDVFSALGFGSPPPPPPPGGGVVGSAGGGGLSIPPSSAPPGGGGGGGGVGGAGGGGGRRDNGSLEYLYKTYRKIVKKLSPTGTSEVIEDLGDLTEEQYSILTRNLQTPITEETLRGIEGIRNCRRTTRTICPISRKI